jgi:hypothetical protein
MPLFEMTDIDFRTIEPTSFGNENVKERQDLQRLLKNHIDEIAPGCMVIKDEFSNWEDSQRRIDLLCVDRQGNLVVVELKRGQTGQHMDLQALRYAAMVSAMTFAQAVETFEQYVRDKSGEPSGCMEELRKFMADGDDEEVPLQPEAKFNRDGGVRIVLVSEGFSIELTTTVLWLQIRGVDIRCVKMTPYRHEGKLLVQTEQVIPLPEAEEFTVKIGMKRAEERSARPLQARLPRDLTFEITVCGNKHPHLRYDEAIFKAVEVLKQCGVTLEQIQAALPPNRLVSCGGRLSPEEMKRAIEQIVSPKGAQLSATKYLCDDEHLIFDGDQTWALKRSSKPRYALQRLDKLKKHFPTKLDFRMETVPGGLAE